MPGDRRRARSRQLRQTRAPASAPPAGGDPARRRRSAWGESGGRLWQAASTPAHCIPRIIHLFAGDSLPRVEAAIIRPSWRRYHSERGWQVREWSDRELRALVAEQAPDFLDTLLAYPADAARWAASRYFVLRRFGGVAVKPGMICLKAIDDLVAGRCVLVAAARGANNRNANTQLTDAAIASGPGHPLWARIEHDLDRRARGSASQAAGSTFLTARVRECHRFLPRDQRAVILESAAFDPAPPAEIEKGRELSRWFRNTWAVPWDTLPIERRRELLSDAKTGPGEIDRGSAVRFDPGIARLARSAGWSRFFGFLSDDDVAEFEAVVEAAERDELNRAFEVRRVINPRPAEHLLATSLFWKHVDVGTPELPTPTLELLQYPKRAGLKLRYEPWKHYVQPLLKGSAKLAKSRPDVTVRVYLAEDLEFLVPMLAEHCEVCLMAHSSTRHCPGAMWRFLAMEDGFDLVSIIDADLVDYNGEVVVRRTEALNVSGAGTWRRGTSSEVDANGYFVYRPMVACHFGTRVRLPISALAKAFVWHLRRGLFPKTLRHPRHGEMCHFQHPWPGYALDEWFLATAVHPRVLPFGLETGGDARIGSAAAADMALAAMASPRSRMPKGWRRRRRGRE
jgi:hypothetical protein